MPDLQKPWNLGYVTIPNPKSYVFDIAYFSEGKKDLHWELVV